MNDEEFKKKLESILGNLYRIDQEAREYLGKENSPLRNREYNRETYKRYEKQEDRKYKK